MVKFLYHSDIKFYKYDEKPNLEICWQLNQYEKWIYEVKIF